MIEKRFTLAYEKGNWWAVRDWDITLWKEEVIHLLNELNDENEQLKRENNLLARFIRRNHDVSMVSRILKEVE